MTELECAFFEHENNYMDFAREGKYDEFWEESIFENGYRIR